MFSNLFNFQKQKADSEPAAASNLASGSNGRESKPMLSGFAEAVKGRKKSNKKQQNQQTTNPVQVSYCL